METINLRHVRVAGVKTVYKQDPDSNAIDPVTQITVQVDDITSRDLADLHALSRDGNLQVQFGPMQARFKVDGGVTMDGEFKDKVGEILDDAAESGALGEDVTVERNVRV